MPHGNIKTRISAKKKGRASRPTQPSSSNASPSDGSPQSQLEAELTDMMSSWQEQSPLEEGRPMREVPPPTPVVDNNDDSLYVRYKKCTQRFKDTLKSMVPNEVSVCDNVHAIMTAAEYIAKQDDMPVEPQLLDDLKLAIRVRKRVAMDQFSGGDQGHSHFIAALAYCWSILAPKRRRRKHDSGTTKKKDTVANQFASLAVSDDAEDIEDDLPSAPLPRPEILAPTQLSLEELIAGSDRMNVTLFLMALDELMRFISIQYSKLKDVAAWIHRESVPADVFIGQMMEAAVATNFAIQQVASFEELFVHDHPHLNTVYRMLACFVCVELVPTLTALVSKKSPIAANFSEKDAVAFFGDVMESSFRNPSDPLMKKQDVLVKEFLKRWKFTNNDLPPSAQAFAMDEVSLTHMVMGVDILSRIEVPLHEEQTPENLEEIRQIGTSSHSWLGNFSFIGNDRSITHTIRMLQGFSNLIEAQQGRLLPKRTSAFGTSWGDRRKPATKIQLDMDSLFLEDIMPTLINMCYEGMLSLNLPYQEELLPAFSHIKTFVRHPESITWSLAFSAHAILTSLFEVQGIHSLFLAKAARQAFEKFIKQLEWVKQIPLTDIPQRPPSWERNINAMLRLRFLVVSPIPRSETEEMLAVWNPFCAGAFLSYVAFYGNLDGGSSAVDSVAQLRMTLHLFNALRQAQAIQPGQIGLLDFLFDAFKNCKAVWEGPHLPTRGQYQTRWWISFGMNARMAVQMQNNPLNPNRGRDGNTTRKMTPVLPEHLCKSFRRICLRDFQDVVDKYHSASTRADPGNKFSSIYHFAVRLNDTLDAMEDEEQLLGTNLASLGHYLNQFCISLFNVWGFMPIVEKVVNEASPEFKQSRRTDFRSVGPKSWEASDENMKYQVMSHLFAKLLLGPLDEGDALVASRCAEFMDVFFNSVPRENVMWLTPTKKAED